MSSSVPSTTARTVPEIERTEHRDVNGVQVKAVIPYGYDGSSLIPVRTSVKAVKVTYSGTLTYVGVAAAGTAQSASSWSCKKIDSSSGVVITWADMGNFSQVATDLTALTYA